MAQQLDDIRSETKRLSQIAFPKVVLVLIPISIVGLLAPFILKSGEAPSWFLWLLKGSDGEGIGFQFLGALALCIVTIRLLEWGGARSNMSALTQLGNWVNGALIAVMLLGGLVFAAIISSILLGLLAPWLTRVLPSKIAVYLHGLDREPGSLILAGIIALLIVAFVCFQYFKVRKTAADASSGEGIADAVFEALAPPFFLAMIALKAFVWFGLLLLAVTEWIPQYFGDGAIWAKAMPIRIAQV